LRTLLIFSVLSILYFGPNYQNVFSQVLETYVDELFFDDFDGDQVNTSVWQIATWREHGGQTGTERCYASDGYLNMLFINDSNEGFLSSAIQTRDEFLYGKWEARLKPSDVPGILNSMYTIDWNNTADNSSNSNGTKQEIDIEFLTCTFSETSGEVHFAVHAEGRESFNLNPDLKLDFNPSDDFHIWGFEISTEKIEWFVDEIILHSYVYSENDIAIDAPYQLKLNVWSAEHWINGPPAENTECLYLIDWIKFTPQNFTGDIKTDVDVLDVRPIFPNPFTTETEFEYSLSNYSEVILTLYNSLGQKIQTLEQGYKDAGDYRIHFDAADLKPGLYFYTIEIDNCRITGKCIKIK
jgi:hypothetical protein